MCLFSLLVHPQVFFPFLSPFIIPALWPSCYLLLLASFVDASLSALGCQLSKQPIENSTFNFPFISVNTQRPRLRVHVLECALQYLWLCLVHLQFIIFCHISHQCVMFPPGREFLITLTAAWETCLFQPTGFCTSAFTQLTCPYLNDMHRWRILCSGAEIVTLPASSLGHVSSSL